MGYFSKMKFYKTLLQNVAKEGLKVDETEKAKERKEAMEKEYEPLLNWLKDKALADKVRCKRVFLNVI